MKKILLLILLAAVGVQNNYAMENNNRIIDMINFPLHEAIINENTVAVRELLDNGYDVNTLDRFGDTALSEAAAHWYIDIFQILLDAGADVNLSDLQSNTPLHFATRRNNIDLVRQLICAGADANIRNLNNESALDVARLLAPRDATAIEQRNRQAIIDLLDNVSRTNRVGG